MYSGNNLFCAIYCWENKLNGKKYIGGTLDVKARFYRHLLGSSNKQLKEDIDEYGVTNFSFMVFEFLEFDNTVSKKEAKRTIYDREQFYIDKYLKDENGNLSLCYNINPSATSGKGRYVGDEVRKKMSDSGKLKRLSEEHKENIRKNHISKKEGFVSWCKNKPMHPNAKAAITKALDKTKIPVAKYSKDGEFLEWYAYIKQAAKKNNLDSGNISRAIRSKTNMYNGFLWKVYNGSTDNIDVSKNNRIIMYDLSLNKIGEFDNAFSIEKEIGIHHTNVAYSIKTGKPTVGRYFEYEKA